MADEKTPEDPFELFVNWEGSTSEQHHPANQAQYTAYQTTKQDRSAETYGPRQESSDLEPLAPDFPYDAGSYSRPNDPTDVPSDAASYSVSNMAPTECDEAGEVDFPNMKGNLFPNNWSGDHGSLANSAAPAAGTGLDEQSAMIMPHSAALPLQRVWSLPQSSQQLDNTSAAIHGTAERYHGTDLSGLRALVVPVIPRHGSRRKRGSQELSSVVPGGQGGVSAPTTQLPEISDGSLKRNSTETGERRKRWRPKTSVYSSATKQRISMPENHQYVQGISMQNFTDRTYGTASLQLTLPCTDPENYTFESVCQSEAYSIKRWDTAAREPDDCNGTASWTVTITANLSREDFDRIGFAGVEPSSASVIDIQRLRVITHHESDDGNKRAPSSLRQVHSEFMRSISAIRKQGAPTLVPTDKLISPVCVPLTAKAKSSGKDINLDVTVRLAISDSATAGRTTDEALLPISNPPSQIHDTQSSNDNDA
ncbi:hypothetical protein I317_02312 [Kwoniella heveanensis CBS 569]|nr:hypothetical protein I317_02312 [Kwoniella heveanensis CBS 569]